MRRIIRIACALLLTMPAARARAEQPVPAPPGAPGGQPPAAAQPPPAAAAPDAPATLNSDHHERISDELDIYQGNFDYEKADTKIYADRADYYPKTHRLLLTGNVVLAQSDNRISADRADFNVDTKIGTFYNAYGIATAKPPKQQVRPGAPAPAPASNQPTDIYFFGDTVEKIGPRKYRITNGGFSPCVQPTPRWQLSAGTMVLNVDHYTILKNAILTVKGVPMLYLPIMYYPTKKEDRATGFLLPTIGTSTLGGEQIHNAFFWAIDRSQDATIEHEYYSKLGQGVSGEYRYNFGGGDDANISAHVLDQHAATYTLDDGSTNTIGAEKSYTFRGGLNEALPGGFRLRANIDYFSSLTTNQTYNLNPYDASLSNRTYGVNLVGAWSGYTINGTFDRTEYFSDANDSGITGSSPKVTVARNERPLFGSDLYFSMTGEYARLLYETKTLDNTTDPATPLDINQGLSRLDITPQIRYPFKKWQWFTVNTTISWRDTYYSRSEDLALAPTSSNPNGIVDSGLNRAFFTAQAQITGPVFNRIWDTPDNGYAEKFKHSVEPYVTVSRTSAIDNYFQIVKIDANDSIYGDTTQLTYGVTNRFFAKRKTVPGRPAVSSEILDVQIEQTYYSNPAASLVDPRYATNSFQTVVDPTAQSPYSPIALTVRGMPTTNINASVRAEFDARYHSLRTISATGGYALTGLINTSVQWTKQGLIPQLIGFNDPNNVSQFVGATTTAHTRDNQYGVAYQFNYDIFRSQMVSQQASGYYNTQCCGLAFQYQTSNFGGLGLPSDHRFFLSFTLAGLGNFSPFNGAMSTVPH